MPREQQHTKTAKAKIRAKAIVAEGGNLTKAAKRIGVSRTHLVRVAKSDLVQEHVRIAVQEETDRSDRLTRTANRLLRKAAVNADRIEDPLELVALAGGLHKVSTEIAERAGVKRDEQVERDGAQQVRLMVLAALRCGVERPDHAARCIRTLSKLLITKGMR